MMVNTKLVKNHTAPMCFIPDGSLVCYHHGEVVILKDGLEKVSIPLFKSFKERYLGRSKLCSRFFRIGVRAVEALDDTNILISSGNYLYELNLNNGEVSKGYYCGEGIRPLIFTTVKGIDGIEDGIYYGGYLGNTNKKPVYIYKRISTDNWEVVYTFPQGSINHVHNIVADPYRNCLWVFTGDFDESAAIWRVTDHFKKVERVACNDQKYRGCVAFAIEEGLLYATDAPFADDYIYLLDTETMIVKELYPIHGSCIYGCQWKNKYVFSSTVEGDGRNMSCMEWLFTRKRGVGIKDEYIHMYIGNLQEGFQEIYKEKKDMMPFYTFQFGVFKFPYGNNKTDSLFFQPVATKKNDLCLMSLTF